MKKQAANGAKPAPSRSAKTTRPKPRAAEAAPAVQERQAHPGPADPRQTTSRPRSRAGARRETSKTLGVYDADRDILDQYLYEVSKTPLLTPQQEIAIAKLVRAGDPEAMQELVKRNLRFVISVAKKYQNRGLPLTDLIGEGNVGLLTAARKFDPDQGVKFISYAVWWIRQAILASLARQGRTVRVPLNRTADLSRIVRTAEALRQELRREPTPEEIANVHRALARRGAVARRAQHQRGAARRAARSRGRPLPDRALHRRGPVGRRGAGDGPLPHRGDRDARSAPCRPATPRCCGSTSASTAGASTPSRRSAACSASPASGCASCATAPSSGCARATSGRALASFAA